MAILQCFQALLIPPLSLRGVSCVPSVLLIPVEEQREVQHSLLTCSGFSIMILRMVPCKEGKKAQRSLHFNIQHLFWQRNLIVDIGWKCFGIHWPQSPGDVLNPGSSHPKGIGPCAAQQDIFQRCILTAGFSQSPLCRSE